ncbi:MAG: guanylate cyclase, partial [Leptolyngbya sp. DLM2.Bin15]
MNESQLLGFLTSYVPRLTILRLATNSHLEKPYGDRLSVALLFADISGFTPLTKKFAQQGAEGAEELTRLLNDYFGQLVTLITNHNGDVVRFAGDALLACWVASPETLSNATLQAVHCAHAVQQALNNYQATSDCQLSLKVSIAAGNATALHVGGVEKRWLFCLGGEAVLSIQDGDRQNLPGNIVLSSKAWALVQPYVTTQPLEQGYVTLQSLHSAPSARCLSKPTLPNPSIPYLKAYISRAIHKRIEAGQINWLAEFRHVTILFIKIMGLDYDSADSVEQMQTMVYPLQSILYRYEGNIVSLGVDDKGTTLLAAFGLPAFSHEDDAIRGVSVALEIQKHLQENLLTSAIGITTGQVFCGPIGNDIRREYTVMGDVVNLAARLMQSAAPNTILCSVATKQATERRIEFDALPPQFLKGFGKNIASFAPRQTIRARQDIKKTSTMMVGRQQEKEILRQGLQRFQEQESSIFIVEGEAGIGKSTLADYFLEQAEALGWMCLTGAGDAIEKSAPYYAWRSVLRQLFQQVLPNGTDRIDGLALDEQQRLLHFLQSSPETADLAPLLNPIFPLNLPDTATTAVLSGDSRADKTREFCVRLLQMHLNQSRAVLVIEDAQWLDTASWTLLGQVSQRVKPLCLVVITRPLSEPLPPEYSQLLAAPSTQYLELNSLTTKDTLALVCQRLGVNELPNPVADLILSKAQGHPFFSEELAYALRDAGVFTIATEQCRLNPLMKDLSFLNLPDTIEGTITSRIDRLTPAQQLMVKVASVIGRTFASRMLRDVYPVDADKDHLLEHLEVLNKLNITLLDSP